MAYQTGTYTDPAVLLGYFRTFITSNGWSENGWASDGTGDRLHIQKGSLYFNLRSAVNEGTSGMFSGRNSYYDMTAIGVNGSTGYAGGSNWDQQPGSINSASGEGGACTYMKTTLGTYHFFATSDSATMFFECDDQYRQITFGQTSRGYPFYSASGNNVNSDKSNFMALGDSGYSSVLYDGVWTYGGTVDRDLNMPLWYHQSNPANVHSILNYWKLDRAKQQFRGNALLFPSHMFRTGGGSYNTTPFNYLGEVEGLKVMNVFGYTDGDVITYAGDEYVVSITNPTGAKTFGVAALK